MSRIACPLIISGLFILLFMGCSDSPSNSTSQIIEVPADQVQVVDGDTIKAYWENQTETIRFLLIDTPELNHQTAGKQPYSEKAKKFLIQQIQAAKTITIEKDQSERDKYGRLLGYIYLDGTSAQEMLLQQGLARVAYVYPPNTKHEQSYRQLEQQAKRKKIGIWSLDGYVQSSGFNPKMVTDGNDPSPSIHQFIASTHSEVYHPIDCQSVVDTIKQKNRVYFQTEKEAQNSGRKRSQVKECWENPS